MPVVSIQNRFDLTMHISVPSGDNEPDHMFLTRTTLRMPVGWEAIELYPPYRADTWDEKFASLWAERDLLAAALQHNVREAHFRAIDPRADARRRMAQLTTDCEELLGGAEEPLHQFIRENPSLLNPTYCRVWSKLPLGNKVTDFVFRQPSGDYLLVELERPSRQLFRSDGQQHSDLTHAIGQIVDWRRYIEDNLGTVQKELGLHGISSNPPCLIVIGRSSSLSDEDKRKLVTLENWTPRLKIMTYDDLLANARATAENFLGPLWDAGPNTEVYFISQSRA
jgi:hypothetical protein